MPLSRNRASQQRRFKHGFKRFGCEVLTALLLLIPHTATRAERSPTSLLGMELSLERVRTWTSTSGDVFIGWPQDDAEAILHVFEVRIPEMQQVIRQHEVLESMYRSQLRTSREMLVVTASNARAWETMAHSWKEAAEATKPSIWERPELWVLLGLSCAVVFVTLTRG